MNKTTATEINKKFVNLPEDLQKYVFEFKQPNIYIEDIEKEILENLPKYEYWKNIYDIKHKEYEKCVQYYIDRKENIVNEDKIYESMNKKYCYNNWHYYWRESHQLKHQYSPFTILQRSYFLNGINDYEKKIFSFLKIGDIFWSDDFLYKIIKKTDSFTFYKKIVPVYVELCDKYCRYPNFFDIQNYTLEDKIYKKKEIKKGVIKIIKSGIY
jgi:hypothetical protein